jgi:filamentous hemagglutinin family protein
MKGRHPQRRVVLAYLAALALVVPSVARGGQVVTDGTLGPARTLSGPGFNVTADLGQTRGGNLFHSFSRLDLDKGDAATFSGPTTVQNVLARVTGGAASNINGTLRCSIPQANFYLINPAGVVFGPDSALDVSGSFAVTTADVVRFTDGGSFNARTPADSVLTTAAPSAFGFLGASPAAVRVSGPPAPGAVVLGVPPGKALSVVAGPSAAESTSSVSHRRATSV